MFRTGSLYLMWSMAPSTGTMALHGAAAIADALPGEQLQDRYDETAIVAVALLPLSIRMDRDIGIKMGQPP